MYQDTYSYNKFKFLNKEEAESYHNPIKLLQDLEFQPTYKASHHLLHMPLQGEDKMIIDVLSNKDGIEHYAHGKLREDEKRSNYGTFVTSNDDHELRPNDHNMNETEKIDVKHDIRISTET